jgi:hypothetical protein
MPYRVVIFDWNIVALIQTGDGATWIRSQAWEIRRWAAVYAPNRTNTLAGSHVVSQNRDRYTGRFQKGFTISATAYHAKFVAFGTGLYGPKHKKIVKKKSMVIRDGRKPRFIRASRGQRPDNYPGKIWLERAAETALPL